MKINASNPQNYQGLVVSLRCPHCGKLGTLGLVGQDLLLNEGVMTGQRRCPDPACFGHVFVVAKGNALIASYPPSRIEFDASNIPELVRGTFEQALDCHAHGLHVAAAIMVRRTLEEICSDRGATGDNLKARLRDLRSKIVLPAELLDGMDELRLLGNDAAHVEALTFNQVSKPELDIAIEFTREVLKALYQYSSLLQKIRSLKAT
jgi:hypothetical protein